MPSIRDEDDVAVAHLGQHVDPRPVDPMETGARASGATWSDLEIVDLLEDRLPGRASSCLCGGYDDQLPAR